MMIYDETYWLHILWDVAELSAYWQTKVLQETRTEGDDNLVPVTLKLHSIENDISDITTYLPTSYIP